MRSVSLLNMSKFNCLGLLFKLVGLYAEIIEEDFFAKYSGC